MLYRLKHTTRFAYQYPASQSLNEARLTPRGTESQKVIESEIAVEPQPSSWSFRKDYFDNDVAAFALLDTHERLQVTATSLVEVAAPAQDAPATPSISWEAARDEAAEMRDPQALQAYEFTFDSPLVSAHPEISAYARETFAPGRSLFGAAAELSHRIHEEFEYKPNSTTIDTPLIQVLQERQGVCQDFAHIMIAGLRSLRLPARYVSGYIRSRANYQGAGASHAWVSVYIPGSGPGSGPGGGWVEFDPTNDMMPTDTHVRIGWGRDYSDVAPIKGISMGGGAQTVEVEVHLLPA